MRAVVVTGASGGIGLATALELSRRGFQVFAGVRTPEAAAQLRHARPTLTPLVIDVSQASSVSSAVTALNDALAGRPLVALVNNAGIAVQGPLETVPLDGLRHQFEVNLFGVARLVQLALPGLRAASRAGHRATIVNLGSIGSRIAMPFNGPYNASKFALAGYTESLRQELRPWGIRVSLVEPGTTKTEIWKKIERSVEVSRGDAVGLYDTMLAQYRTSVQALQRAGMPPHRVATAIADLIAARRPAPRKLVGDARFMALLAWLPSSVRDWLVARGLGLPARGALLGGIS